MRGNWQQLPKEFERQEQRCEIIGRQALDIDGRYSQIFLSLPVQNSRIWPFSTIHCSLASILIATFLSRICCIYLLTNHQLVYYWPVNKEEQARCCKEGVGWWLSSSIHLKKKYKVRLVHFKETWNTLLNWSFPWWNHYSKASGRYKVLLT